MKSLLKFGLAGLVLGVSPAVAQDGGFESVEFRDIELFRAAYSVTDAMDFDSGPGDLTLERATLQGFVGKPLTAFRDITLVPFAALEYTKFDLDGAPIGIHDEDLHSLSLGLLLKKDFAGTPWSVFGFGRGELATDFQDITGDDFTFDAGLIANYKFSETFSAGLGAVVINLNGEEEIYPGIALNWKPNDCYQISVTGVVAQAVYSPSEDWNVSLRARPAGGDWNIDNDNGESVDIDLSSFRSGLFVSRRITGGLWLEVGGGLTFSNELELRDEAGRTFFSDDLDEGVFGQVALSLRSW